MADNNFLFEIDAGKILAKMHLGGQMKYKNLKFFNTGILNNEDKKPEDITAKSKITFDFENKSGIYEIGVLVPDVDIKMPNTPDEIASAEYGANKEVEDDVDKQSGITDDAEEVDKKKEEEKEKLSPEEIKKMQEENKKAFNDTIIKGRKIAVGYLQAYMTSFAGAEEAKKINEKNVIITYLSDKDTDPFKIKYKDWKIPALNDKEVHKQWDEQLKKGDLKAFTLHNVCYKTAYSLEMKVEK